MNPTDSEPRSPIEIAGIRDAIARLEITLAHQQRTTDQLNEIVTEQNRELFTLGRCVDRLTRQVNELRQSGSVPRTMGESMDAVDEKPPHY